MRAAAIVLVGVTAGGLGCDPGGADLGDCRSFATEWDGQSPGTPLVIGSSGEVTYTQPGPGGVSSYGSIEDFITEGKELGRFTRTSTVAANLESRQFAYDGSGRQIEHSRESLTPGPTGYETAAWTEFDGLSRPISGDHESSWSEAATPNDRLDTCSGSTVTVSYDEDARTVTTVVDYSGTLSGGGACVDTPFINILGRIEIEYFDGANNWLRVETWQGFQEPNGDPQQTLTVGRITASETVCPGD